MCNRLRHQKATHHDVKVFMKFVVLIWFHIQLSKSGPTPTCGFVCIYRTKQWPNRNVKGNFLGIGINNLSCVCLLTHSSMSHVQTGFQFIIIMLMSLHSFFNELDIHYCCFQRNYNSRNNSKIKVAQAFILNAPIILM